jgi:hypothetical protein
MVESLGFITIFSYSPLVLFIVIIKEVAMSIDP